MKQAPKNGNPESRPPVQQKPEVVEQNRRPGGPSEGGSKPSTSKPKTSNPAENAAMMRRAIGAMAELQSMFETQGHMDPGTIFQVCSDMGIEPEDAVHVCYH